MKILTERPSRYQAENTLLAEYMAGRAIYFCMPASYPEEVLGREFALEEWDEIIESGILVQISDDNDIWSLINATLREKLSSIGIAP
jgi:hypothetical protein